MSRLNVFLNRPVYWFRPVQVFSRLRDCTPRGVTDVVVSWGGSIHCNTGELIGKTLQHQGIYDLVVSEVICRLVPPGGTALDVGANIGHMSGLMAKSAGRLGRVIAFEPSSRLRPTLMRNVEQWNRNPGFAQIDVRCSAASDCDGSSRIYYPIEIFSSNQGTASLENSWLNAVDSSDSEEIQTTTLDSLLASNPDLHIDLLKIDVEGHELAVFRGAAKLLGGRHIKHIVFEEYATYPSPVQDLLMSHGYRIYRLSRNFVRIQLRPAGEASKDIDFEPNYLATLDVPAAEQALASWGWRALRG